MFKSDKTYSAGGLKSAYSLRRKDGATWYFDRSGSLLAMKDRFGSSIRFEHVKINGTAVSFAYDASDARGRTSGIRAVNQAFGAAFLDLSYEFTNSGNVARIRDASDGGSLIFDYGYSCANQLTLAMSLTPDGVKTVEYAYDGAGNRVREKRIESGTTLLYAYSRRPARWPTEGTGSPGSPRTKLLSSTTSGPGTMTPRSGGS